MTADTARIVREAMGAGRWFPGSEEELRGAVDGYIEKADSKKVNGRIVSVLAPHAGYQYSGPVAGYTFRAIKDNAAAGHKPDVVVILGFSHRQGFPGVALMDGDAVSTPLGESPLDQDAIKILESSSELIRCNYNPHAGEHSAENEIPFVQAALPDAKLVVAIIGDHDPRTLDELVKAMVKLDELKKTLVVSSTDMLHDANYNLVTETDKATLKLVERMNHAKIQREWNGSRQTFCGVMPVLAAMRYAEKRGCKKGTVLHYRNSGDDYPESRGQWVVGYGAVVFTAE